MKILVALMALTLAPRLLLAAPLPTRFCEHAEKRVATAERRYAASCQRSAGCSANSKRRLDKLVAKVADRCVALNQVQVLGTHNSYHIEARPTVIAALLAITSAFEGIQYTHLPLERQFETQGIRQIEIDVYADPNGGLFATRHGLSYVGEDPASGIPALDAPGFKVLHLPDIDFETTCLTFVDCLQTVKAWSAAHPAHLPIAIQIEAKEDALPDIFNLGFITPLPIGPAEFDVLDAEIRSVFSEDEMITPDDVRGGYPTLEQAVVAKGWPLLPDARGKVLFLLDNGGGTRDAYRRGHAALEGLILFTNSNPGQPDAAFVKRNDAVGDEAEIRDLVRAGYLVRTRADGDTVQARSGDTTAREAALRSGAQFVSTDYPQPDPRFTDYAVTIPGGQPGRCNPVNGAPGCRAVALEP